MSLYLDVVCTEAQLTSYERQEKSVQVIGEILPYVLAKYGVSNQLPVPVRYVLPPSGSNVLPPSGRNVVPPSGREVPVRRFDF
jgi:hypothetical protein